MKNAGKIRQMIEQLAGTFNKDVVSITLCNVDSVDQTKNTCNCTPVTGDADTAINDIFLNAEGNDGEIKFPVVGSKIWIAISTRNEAFVFQFDLLDKYLLITQTLTQFNDGAFGGLTKVIELTTKLNNVENLLNDLITKYNSHIHSGVTTGGGVSGTTPATESGSITPTQRSDIENPKIIHGS